MFNPPPGCRLPWTTLPENTEVFAATSLGASRPAGFAIDQSGSEAQIIEAIVNAPGRSVALMLSYTVPTIWQLRWTPGTDIQAVWVSGAERNVVAGLPRGVPVLETVRKDTSACGSFVWYRDNFEQADALANMAFGRPVSQRFKSVGTQLGIVLEGVNDRPPPPFVIGAPLAPGAKTLSSNDNPPASFVDPLGERVGTAGLRALVKAGALRTARRAEYTEWLQRWRAKQDVPPVEDSATAAMKGSDELASTFVVNRALKLPARLHGAHAATFIVPVGIPLPEGDLGHSTVLDMNTLTCRGSSCPPEVSGAERSTTSAGAAAVANCRWPWTGTTPPSRVYALAGGSGRPTGMRLAGSQDEATVLDVVVNAPGQDVALMLAVAEPRIWNVRWSPGTRITAAYLSSRSQAAVRGLGPATPVLSTSSFAPDACPSFVVARETLTQINPLARAAFGKAADAVILGNTPGGPIGHVRIGPPLADGTALEGGVSSAHRDALTGGVTSPVTVALNDAVARGVLRRATQAEELEYGNAWRRTQGLAPAWQVSTADARELFDAYVVLKPFQIPSGINDSPHRASRFIVPRGVPAPTGDRRGVVVMDWNLLPQ